MVNGVHYCVPTGKNIVDYCNAVSTTMVSQFKKFDSRINSIIFISMTGMWSRPYITSRIAIRSSHIIPLIMDEMETRMGTGGSLRRPPEKSDTGGSLRNG